ncbi:MAG: VWA domain-containing protein [Acidobacteriia bacterium]|nr:VWA domain-containing protein [Terriglobia bacterium]
MKKLTTKKNQQGMAVIMTVLTMMIALPLVGLAFDVGVLYMIRGKLYQAVDAASLAGARALGQGPDSGTQVSNAQAAATKYFNANFPSGFWGTISVSMPTPTVDSTSTPNYRSVTTRANVTAPLYFLRMLGQNTATIAAISVAGRRDALVMLVLDRSSSMTNPFQGSTACAIMKTDAAQFVSNFAQGRDMVGLVIFGSSAFTFAPTTSFGTPDASGNTVASLINQISCGGNTNMVEGVHQAYAQIQAVNVTTRANVIVLMTDGRPNGFTGNYKPYQKAPCNSANLRGVYAQWAGGPLPSGTTAGLMLWVAPNASYNSDAVTPDANSNCKMLNTGLTSGYNDFTQMPPTDVYGNSTTGPYSANNPNSPYNSTTVNLTNITIPQWVEVAGANALDNQGTTIRNNATLKPAIYTIALEGNSLGDPPDTLLLRKLANDPTMENDADSTTRTMWTGQNPGQTKGFFVDAPDPSQLCAAFNQIATQIVVRLAK